jgi:hypothetical protein
MVRDHVWTPSNIRTEEFPHRQYLPAFAHALFTCLCTPNIYLPLRMLYLPASAHSEFICLCTCKIHLPQHMQYLPASSHAIYLPLHIQYLAV